MTSHNGTEEQGHKQHASMRKGATLMSMRQETEDMGTCIQCDMPFDEYDRAAFEVRATWHIRDEHGKWVPRTADGFTHDDCIDKDMTIIERIEG